jgi:lipid-binding SYLF domain-containing protein
MHRRSPSFLSLIALTALAIAGKVVAGTLTEPVKRTIADFQRTDPGLTNLFASAKGYVVFPENAKGGLVFGGAHGQGHVFAGGQLIGGVELTQITVGAQIGGQVYSEVIFFETESALTDFKAGKLKLSAQVSAIVAAEGVAEHAKYHHGVAIFTLPRQGLMGEAAVGGQKFRFKPLTVQP